MYQEILDYNKAFIEDYTVFWDYSTQLQNLVNILNTNKIAQVTWLKWCGKTALIHLLLKKTNSFDTSFYFHAGLDTMSHISSREELITYFDIHVRIHGIPKIIILQDTQSISGIKEFILELIHTKKYKIILVGNNMKISGVQEIECFSQKHTKESIENHIYGNISAVSQVWNTGYKKYLLSGALDSIILGDILSVYPIKNINLLKQIYSFIASSDSYLSIRELQRQLKLNNIDVSLITLIEYLTIFNTVKCIKKVPVIDLKSWTEIRSRTFYYFGDTGIRYIVWAPSEVLIKNTTFIELQSHGYEVNSAKYGTLEFDFYGTHTTLWNICVHVDSTQDKNEIRKQARKLAKVPNSSRKYIIVENKNSLGMRKFEESWVEIISLKEFIEKLK